MRTDHHRFSARVHDLSARGCKLSVTDAHLTVGEVVAVGFHGLELMAKAVSSTTDGADQGVISYGLAFERPSPETQGRLFRLLGELRVASLLEGRAVGT